MSALVHKSDFRSSLCLGALPSLYTVRGVLCCKGVRLKVASNEQVYMKQTKKGTERSRKAARKKK